MPWSLQSLSVFKCACTCAHAHPACTHVPKKHNKNHRGNQYLYVGQTEWIKNNTNPQFKTTIEMDYLFEEKQIIRFIVIDVDDPHKVVMPNAYLFPHSSAACAVCAVLRVVCQHGNQTNRRIITSLYAHTCM